MATDDVKALVRDHWNREVCGTRYGGSDDADRAHYFERIDEHRYVAHPMLECFASFPDSRGKRVLEVGLGTGSDFVRWARAGAEAHGRDLTEASVELAQERLSIEGLSADVQVGDAEKLEFPGDFFDIYYSWGVLHHTPDTVAAIAEAHRVLKPGGSFKIMMYHFPSVSSGLLWLAKGPLRLNFLGPRRLFAESVESPGTKMYTQDEARRLVEQFFSNRPVDIRTYLGGADLLTHQLSSSYGGREWEIVRSVFPRRIVKRVLGDRFGTVMTIHSVK